MASLYDVDVEAVIEGELLSRAARAGQVLQIAAESVLTGARSGRIYRKPGGGTYQASAPGEPPAERTGALRHSWRPLAPTIQSNGTGATVRIAVQSSGVPYVERFDPALVPHIGHLPARPFVEKVLDLAAPGIDAVLNAPLADKL